MLTLPNPEPREKLEAVKFAMHFGSHGESEADLKERLDSPKVLPTKGQGRLTNEELEERVREGDQRFADMWWDYHKDHCERFRSAVESIISDKKAARLRLQPEIEEALKKVVAVPRIGWNRRELTKDIYYMCEDIVGVFGYSLALMLAVNGKIGKALKKCKFEYCGRLFLSFPPPTGGPRPVYCDPEHKKMADGITGAERTARWREKKRRQSKKKRARGKK
jgi:hypothetical protein